VDDLESHSGAETMPADTVLALVAAIHIASSCPSFSTGTLTILIEDIEALLDQQRRVQYDQAVADGQHIVARPRLQEGAYRPQALNLLLVSRGQRRARQQVAWSDKGRRVKRRVARCRVRARHSVRRRALLPRTA
jgi:hypothetical protein